MNKIVTIILIFLSSIAQAQIHIKVTEADFNRFNETSIVSSFNTKPGIRIEEHE